MHFGQNDYQGDAKDCGGDLPEKRKMHLLVGLLSSFWFWVDVALSVTGGIVVYWGLKVEKKAERLLPPEDFKPDLFEDIVKAQKSELERGWHILMFGIVFEVVAALGISIISGTEIAVLNDRSANIEATNATLVASNLLVAGQLVTAQSNLTALQSKVLWRSFDPNPKQKAELAKRAGTLFAISSEASEEPKALAEEIRFVLTSVGWRQTNQPVSSFFPGSSHTPPDKLPLREGVAVFSCGNGAYTTLPAHPGSWLETVQEATHAASKLNEIINANRIEADEGINGRQMELAPEGIVIVYVGFIPGLYPKDSIRYRPGIGDGGH